MSFLYTIWLVRSLGWIGSGVFGFDLERGVQGDQNDRHLLDGVTEAGRHDFTHFRLYIDGQAPRHGVLVQRSPIHANLDTKSCCT